MNVLPGRAEMECAFLASDASYDGIFVAGVRTTGIFCRPSCPARKPRPENVEYFATIGAASSAGYRPCKRCSPMQTNGATPEWLQPLLEKMDAAPAERFTAEMLRAMGIDPVRTRRYFLKHHGMTFNAWCRARRLGSALEGLREGGTLDDAALDHGYESHSGFRDAFVKLFGQSPGRSRATECITVSSIESPLGPLLAGAMQSGLCLLEFTERERLEAQVQAFRRRFACTIVPGRHAHLDLAKDELGRYFAGRLEQFTVPLNYVGTPFQQRVWSALLRIPYGQTQSYEDIARAVGSPGAVRAVGTANGSNRIAIIIPCHRVVNKSGELGGYGGGLWRKRFLLALEKGELPDTTSTPDAARVAR